MVLARPLTAESPDDLSLAFDRLALSEAAGETFLRRLPHFTLLLTGLSRVQVTFLRSVIERGDGQHEPPMYLAGDVRLQPNAGILSGRREQLTWLVTEARREESLAELADAVEAAVHEGPAPALELGGKVFEFGRATYIVGVLNVTPDSFSDAGRFREPAAAVSHAEALIGAGADVIDIGGESTRPGSSGVTAEEELSRVLPVIRALRKRTDVPLSIDTTKARVARAALEAGVSLVNDISGLQADPELPGVISRLGAACCLMHMRGRPETMQVNPSYEDVVSEVLSFLREAAARAHAAGVSRGRVVVDPGIGFGKTVGHNLFLLRRLRDLRVLGCPVLVGTSRKSFLGHVTGRRQPGERLAGTLSSMAVAAVLAGADFVRVHDVAEVKDALRVAEAIRDAQEGGRLFAWPES